MRKGAWCLVVALALFISGCGAAQGDALPVVDVHTPRELPEAWDWAGLSRQVAQAEQQGFEAEVIVGAIAGWLREHGAAEVQRADLGQGGGVSATLVAATSLSVPAVRHVVVYAPGVRAAGSDRALEAGVLRSELLPRRRGRAVRIHWVGRGDAPDAIARVSGRGPLPQLWRTWRESALVGGEDLDALDEGRRDGRHVFDAKAYAQRWEAFWDGYRVPLFGVSALAYYDAVLHLLAGWVEDARAERGGVWGHAPLPEAWQLAAGAWLGEHVRASCEAVAWVPGEESVSDLPSLAREGGFRARPISFVRGRIEGDERRSVEAYLQQARDGCERL